LNFSGGRLRKGSEDPPRSWIFSPGEESTFISAKELHAWPGHINLKYQQNTLPQNPIPPIKMTFTNYKGTHHASSTRWLCSVTLENTSLLGSAKQGCVSQCHSQSVHILCKTCLAVHKICWQCTIGILCIYGESKRDILRKSLAQSSVARASKELFRRGRHCKAALEKESLFLLNTWVPLGRTQMRYIFPAARQYIAH